MDYFRINRPDGGRNNLGLSASYYPEQNNMYVGRHITIRFKDETDGTNTVRERNTHKEPRKPVFFVLRWDVSENGVVILIDHKNRVVVVPTKDLTSHLWYRKRWWDDIVFLYHGELTEEEFNEQIYSKEKIYVHGQQEDRYLLYSIISEYEDDRFNGISLEDRTRDTVDFDAVVEEVKRLHPERETWPYEILRSYRSYFNEHRNSEIDVPMRAINTGFVICCDKYNTVIVEYDRDGNRRFITDKEANIYFAPEDTYKTTWEELDLWHGRLGMTYMG